MLGSGQYRISCCKPENSVMLQQSSIRISLGSILRRLSLSGLVNTIERTDFEMYENLRKPPPSDELNTQGYFSRKSKVVSRVAYSMLTLRATACSKSAQPCLRASHFASTLKFDVLQSQLQPRFEANSTRHCPAVLRVPSFHSSPGYI